jgi:hypothetical protein
MIQARNKPKGEIWAKEGSAHEFLGRRELEDRQSPYLEEYCLLFTTLFASKGSAEKEAHQ